VSGELPKWLMLRQVRNAVAAGRSSDHRSEAPAGPAGASAGPCPAAPVRAGVVRIVTALSGPVEQGTLVTPAPGATPR